MSGGCIYPILNSYFPSKYMNCKNLKYLSACSFLQHLSKREDARLIFRVIPFSICKFLFQASISYFYMTKLKDNTCMTHLPKPIVHLLFHWPHEFLYLEDVFPYHNSYNNNEEPYYLTGDKTQRIYGEVAAEICQHLLEIDLNIQSLDFIKELDLTGNFGYNTNMKYMEPQYILKVLNRKSSAEFSKLKFSSFKYNFSKKKNKEINVNKVKLIIGVVMNSSEDIAAMEKILELNNKTPGPVVIIQFKRIIQNFSPPPWKLLSSILSENGCQSLRLIYISDVDLDTLSDICECLPQLHDLSLLGNPLPSLTCLKHLQNLEHLSLIGKGVSGQLEKLNDLRMGLKYLKLVDCKLTNSDLDILSQSHHVESLQQLDMYRYNHTEPIDNSSGLLALCQCLQQITVLQFNWCQLHLWSRSHLERLIDILKSLPKLTLLDLLRRSQFSEEQLLIIFAKIGSSRSLKIIEIEYPEDVDKNLREEFKIKFKHALNIDKNTQVFEVILGLKNISIVNYIY